MSTTRSDLACSFCGKTRVEVKKFVAGPQGYICDGCIREVRPLLPANVPQPRVRARGPLPIREPTSHGTGSVFLQQWTQSCSFCGKPPAEVPAFTSGRGANICIECIGLSLDIIGEGAPEDGGAARPKSRDNVDWDARDYAIREGVLDKGGGVTRLPGCGAACSYYRVADSCRSWVVMVPSPAPDLSPAAAYGRPPSEARFVDLHRYLLRADVHLPRIQRYEELTGRVLLEDLFDSTLDCLVTPDSGWELYERAVDLLASMRARAERSPDPDFAALASAFDPVVCRWELDHFFVWGLVARTGRQPSTADRAVLDRAFDAIAAEVGALPAGFSFGDYHSRHIIVKERAVGVIAFQEALLAPRQYDLVTLLRDPFLELEQPVVDAMIERYLKQLASHGVDPGDPVAFRRAFDLLTVQRNLRDAGRFVFMLRMRSDPAFSLFVPTALGYVKAALSALPDLSDLAAVLARSVPEFA